MTIEIQRRLLPKFQSYLNFSFISFRVKLCCSHGFVKGQDNTWPSWQMVPLRSPKVRSFWTHSLLLCPHKITWVPPASNCSVLDLLSRDSGSPKTQRMLSVFWRLSVCLQISPSSFFFFITFDQLDTSLWSNFGHILLPISFLSSNSNNTILLQQWKDIGASLSCSKK